MPVPRQAERPPALRRPPVLPAGRPRARRDHPLALRADLRRLGGRPDAELDRLLELVLVLPAPLAGRADDDVERLVGRVDPAVAHDRRRLQVHVPAQLLPGRRPVDLDAVSRTGLLEAQHMGLLPFGVERRRVGHPALQVALGPAAHRLALVARPAVDRDAVVPRAHVAMRERPADGSAVDRPFQDDVTRPHAPEPTGRRLGACEGVSVVRVARDPVRLPGAPRDGARDD